MHEIEEKRLAEILKNAIDNPEHVNPDINLQYMSIVRELGEHGVGFIDPFWFCSFDGCEGACKECKYTCEMSILVKNQIKGAEKLAKLIKDYYTNNKTYDRPNPHTMIVKLFSVIDEALNTMRGGDN